MSIAKKSRALAVVVLLCSAGIALAHSGATGIVKERMEMMEDVGKQMKIVGQMLKGETAFDATSAKQAAKIIAAHAQELPALFPENSTDHPSEALPEIWVDWDKFVALSEKMDRDAIALASVAKTATDAADLREAFGEVGKTCSACHEDFRKAQ